MPAIGDTETDLLIRQPVAQLAYSRAQWAGNFYKKAVSEGEKLAEERRAASVYLIDVSFTRM